MRWEHVCAVPAVALAVLFTGCGLFTVKGGASFAVESDTAGPPPNTSPTFRIETLADAARVAEHLHRSCIGRELYVRAVRPVSSIQRQGTLVQVQGHLIVLKLKNGHEFRSELEDLNDVWVL